MQVAELVAGSGGTVDPAKPYAEFWYACQCVHARDCQPDPHSYGCCINLMPTGCFERST